MTFVAFPLTSSRSFPVGYITILARTIRFIRHVVEKYISLTEFQISQNISIGLARVRGGMGWGVFVGLYDFSDGASDNAQNSRTLDTTPIYASPSLYNWTES